MNKLYVTPDNMYRQSFELGKKILESGFKPSFIIALWRGGSVVGMCVHELMKYNNVQCDHIAVRTSSYIGTTQKDEIAVHGLNYVIDTANTHDSLLIIDDIFDSGRSVKALIDKIRIKMRNNTPAVIKVATVYYKPANNKTTIIPDFYCEETDRWVVFPHEIEAQQEDEIRESKGDQIADCVFPKSVNQIAQN